MSITQPEQFSASYLGQERGRVDVVALGRGYCPNKEQAMQYKNVYFRSSDHKHNAIQLLAALIECKRKAYIFVNADQDQIDAVWKLLCETTSLDVRNNTIGYNAFGLTIYK